MANGVASPDSRDGGVIGSAGITPDASDDGGPSADRAEEVMASCVHCDSFGSFLCFLAFKGDGNCTGVVKVGVKV